MKKFLAKAADMGALQGRVMTVSMVSWIAIIWSIVAIVRLF